MDNVKFQTFIILYRDACLKKDGFSQVFTLQYIIAGTRFTDADLFNMFSVKTQHNKGKTITGFLHASIATFIYFVG